MSQESRLAEGEEANTPTQMPRCRGESKTFNNRLVRASWPITSPAQAGGGEVHWEMNLHFVLKDNRKFLTGK